MFESSRYKHKVFVSILLASLVICLGVTCFSYASVEKKESGLNSNSTTAQSDAEDSDAKLQDNQQGQPINFSNGTVQVSNFDELKLALESFDKGTLTLVINSNINLISGITIKEGQDIRLVSSNTKNPHSIIKSINFSSEMFTVDANAKLHLDNLKIDGGAKWNKIDKSANSGIKSSSNVIRAVNQSELIILNSFICNCDCDLSFSPVFIDKGANSTISNTYFADNKSVNAGSSLSVFGQASIENVVCMNNIATDFSGAIYISCNGKLLLGGKLNIENNYCGNKKSDIYSDADEYGIIVNTKLEDGSRIGLNFSRSIVQGGFYAVCGQNYDADFGSCRGLFFFNQETALKPYCKLNKLSAEYLDVKNGDLVGSGSIDNPYQISQASDFIKIENNPGANYQIVNNLDFISAGLYRPICENDDSPFTGTLTCLDGAKTIANLIINTNNKDGLGLFYKISGSAKISDLYFLNNCMIAINNPTVKYAGSFCAKIEGSKSVRSNLAETCNLLNCTSDAMLYFHDPLFEQDKNIVVGGLVGISDGGIYGSKFTGKFLHGSLVSIDEDYYFNNYQNIGSLVGVQNWKSNSSTNLLPENITSHSGGMTGKSQNSLEDVVAMINCNPDIIEVDVQPDKYGVPRLGHDDVSVNSPSLKGVLLLLIGSTASEYSYLIDDTIKRYRDREKIQLDIKGKSTLSSVLPVLEDLKNNYNFPINKIVLAGDTTYGWLIQRCGLVDDNTKGLRYAVDVLNELADEGLIMGMNSDRLYTAESLNNHDSVVIKRFLDEMNFDQNKNTLFINAFHKSVSTADKCWEWLKGFNINLSLWVIDDESSADINFKRGLYNITTKKWFVLNNRNDLRNMISNSSCSTYSLIPLCGSYDV